MIKIGLIREGKTPADNRVALTPAQCKWINTHRQDMKVVVQHSETRCYNDKEYQSAGIEVYEDMNHCDVLMGIKEVPVEMLLAGKTYLFFSHTKKLQPHNRMMLQAMINKKITLVDYECLEYSDGARIIGFGFFAGVVGAHNGMMAYGNRTGAFSLGRVYASRSFQQLIHTYFGLKVPPIKIAVTGSGRVAHGILEIMNLLGIHETEPAEYLKNDFDYPVYVHLKGADLYRSKINGTYDRDDFHMAPQNYQCLFPAYLPHSDILMNGVYWEKNIPRLFQMDEIADPGFRLQTIADITDDQHGSVPCNLGDATMEQPVYGVDKSSFARTAPYLEGSVDVMAVGNLPNELPRDASRYFGEQLIKHILDGLVSEDNLVIQKAMILNQGVLTDGYVYMKSYAGN